MIDTGASGTVISQGLADKLGISPIGTALINTPSSTNVTCFQFDVQIVFPNNVNIASIVVTEAPLQGQHIQCLLVVMFYSMEFLFTPVMTIRLLCHFKKNRV